MVANSFTAHLKQYMVANNQKVKKNCELQLLFHGCHLLKTTSSVETVHFAEAYELRCMFVVRSVKVMTAESPLTSVDFMYDGATLAVGSTRGNITN